MQKQLKDNIKTIKACFFLKMKNQQKMDCWNLTKEKTGCNHRAGQEVEQTACRQEQNAETAQRQHQNHQSMFLESEKNNKKWIAGI